MSSYDSKWRGGQPPAVGWYPASASRANGVYRWWDGKVWSYPAYDYSGHSMDRVRHIASLDDGHQDSIEWRHQPRDWPENARTYPR